VEGVHHATQGLCGRAGGSPATGPGAAEAPAVAERSRPDPRMRRQFRDAMAQRVPAAWSRRAESAAHPGAPHEADGRATAASRHGAPQRGDGARLPHGAVDDGPDCRADQADLRRAVSSRPCRAADAHAGMEPPKARGAGAPARRSPHHRVEAPGLVAGKKNAARWAPTSSSSTNRASS
jgi:hypothetical protein